MEEQFTEWHSVRPWHPTLSLAVREITSVSVTFILSCPYSAPDPANPETSVALSSSDDEDQSRDSASTSDSVVSTQVVADILAKGLFVKVNGTPWQKVFLKMDEVFDEGIIILYGLMPARQYDIELGLSPQVGQTSVRGQITTGTEARSDIPIPDPNTDEAAVTSLEATMSSTIPLTTSPSHGNGSTHVPIPPPVQLTLEDRRLQLTHELNALNAEHSLLTSRLKSTRKDSQKADAALRSEIDTLKRASERYAAGESRARQKILALQEAVKQTLAAAQDIEALIKSIEADLPGLEQRRAEVEKEYLKVKEEAARVRARRDEAEQREKARTEAMQAELAGLANRLEKLAGKREKLEGEGGVLAELEARLRKLGEERERVERDPYGYESEVAAAESEDGSRGASEGRSKGDSSPDGERVHHAPLPMHAHHQQSNNFHLQSHTAHPRKRHSHPHMHNAPHANHHPRLSFPPRPAGPAEPARNAGRASFPAANGVPGVIQLPSHGPAHRKHNHSHHQHQQQHHNQHPHRGALHSPAGGSPGSGSSSASPTPITATGTQNQTGLSTRAALFEPGRSRSRAPSQSHSVQGSQAGGRSELNPGTTPFAPRTGVAQAAGTIGSGKGGLPSS
ncbi:hypothetical protein BN946_scf184693.g1 [Trametes cinnabarina]|uniref:Uncharacterized protein n=1 Tax=Pycnoporus cinnabarinus TaxID=5643 RepID=A0A060SLN9_PYCCI|nr:hypothetical protein BN946_scf184693.g1 [Trametes cinnabarina]